MNNLTSDSEDTDSSDDYENNEIKFSLKKIP